MSKKFPTTPEGGNSLTTLIKYYVEWAELQVQNQNYNIALFLYGQALSIDPTNSQIFQRIEQIQELKNS